ncbi:MAG: response regulator transcription factor [Bacteroidia bacterium]|nr:response regulator transcription factor [Bacteroidia bacterium]
MKIKCLLVDDEPPALEVLRTHIEATPMLEVVGECHHALAAFEFLQHHAVDLIFLDVRMPRLSGTDLIKSLPNPPQVIFTTAHREYALDGFDLGAVDFLLKPISLDRFLRAVHKVVHKEHKAAGFPAPVAPNEAPFLYFRVDRKMLKVFLHEIEFVESLKDYVRITVAGRQLITKQTITAVEKLLPRLMFIRVHRSFIVSLAKIESFTHHDVYIGKHAIPVGPLYRMTLQQQLHKPL